MHQGRSCCVFLLLLFTSVAFSAANLGAVTALGEAVKPVVKIIVDSAVYDLIKISFDQYVEDVESAGFSANVTLTDQLSDGSALGLRSHLQQFLDRGLAGAVLIGDVAEAYFEVGDHKFPTDMYYMDLDGIWFDLDGNGVYDARGGNLDPEIWIGRLKVSTIGRDQAALLNAYFTKNHAYRNGLFNIPWWRSLLYIDDMGTFNVKEAEASLGYVSPDRNIVADPSTTTTMDYKKRLGDTIGYQWLYLMSHGEVGKHDFYVPTNGAPELEGTVYSSDYSTINPRITFYQFFTCAASRYTDQNYLAGSAIFTTQWGLGAIGSSDDMLTVPVDSFYRSLSEGKNLGDSFKYWLGQAAKTYAASHTSEERYLILCNAVNLIGDPTLISFVENHDVAVTNLEVSLGNSTGGEFLSISATVENHGEFAEQVRIEIFYDRESVFVLTLALETGEQTIVVFSPLNSAQFIWGKHKTHSVEAKTSIALGEFHTNDNSQAASFNGKIITDPRPTQLSPLVYVLAANVVFGVAGWGIIRAIMSDRPLIFACLSRVFRSLAKKHGS